MSKATTTAQLRAAAERAQGFTADVAKAAAEAIEEMGETKADKPGSIAVSIPATGWEQDQAGQYPLYYDIPVEGVTAAQRADVIIESGSMQTARACGFSTNVETLAGKVRVRAQLVPTGPITAKCWIMEKEGATH